MATNEAPRKAVKVPHGQPIPEGVDLDTSDYVNEKGPYDDDITTHPDYHESKYVGHQEPLLERINRLKSIRGEVNPDEVTYTRSVDTRKGLVTVKLYFPDGDRFGGQGTTTEEAVTALEDKLNRIFPAEEAVK